MRWHPVSLAQVLKHCRHRSLKPAAQKTPRHILELLILAGGKIKRAFAVTRVDVLEEVDLHLLEQRAALRQLMTKKGRIRVFRIHRLPPPDPAAKADENY